MATLDHADLLGLCAEIKGRIADYTDYADYADFWISVK